MSQQHKTASLAARFVIVGLSAVGLSGVGPIAFLQLTGVAKCPALGPIPACYVVTFGYLLTGISAFAAARSRAPIFAAGWVPVVGLALLGTSMEVLGQAACPRSASNVPTCFFSFGIGLILIVAFIADRYFDPTSDQ